MLSCFRKLCWFLIPASPKFLWNMDTPCLSSLCFSRCSWVFSSACVCVPSPEYDAYVLQTLRGNVFQAWADQQPKPSWPKYTLGLKYHSPFVSPTTEDRFMAQWLFPFRKLILGRLETLYSGVVFPLTDYLRRLLQKENKGFVCYKQLGLI